MSEGPAAAGDGAVRTVFFGSGSFAVPVLEALHAMPGVDVVAVVSAPDKPVGRKAVLTPTPVSAAARSLDVPLLQPPKVRAAESVAAIAALAPQLAVLADYGQLIPRSLLDLPARGFLNLHPSALPRHRGAAPIPATILAGDTSAAVTLMVLVEELDAGPIIATAPLEVRPDDTATTLEERAAHVGADLLTRALPGWLAGRLEAKPQSQEGMTLTRPLRREDGRLNPGAAAAELERQVRAYQPWPGSFLETPLDRVIVWRAGVADGQADDLPAHVVADGRGIALVAGDGRRLLLHEVQLAGKNRVSGEEFRRGHPGIVGQTIA